jgi:hypothetical protein
MNDERNAGSLNRNDDYMTSSFITFLDTGEFPGLTKPITIESMVAELGPPEDTVRLDTSWLYKYQAAQFILNDDGAVGLYIYFPMLELGMPIDISPLSITTTLYELIELLNDGSIMWEIDQEHSFGDQVSVKTDGDVCILFSLSYLKLNKIACQLQTSRQKT